MLFIFIGECKLIHLDFNLPRFLDDDSRRRRLQTDVLELLTLIRSWWILARSLVIALWAASGSTAKRTGVGPTAVSPSYKAGRQSPDIQPDDGYVVPEHVKLTCEV